MARFTNGNTQGYVSDDLDAMNEAFESADSRDLNPDERKHLAEEIITISDTMLANGIELNADAIVAALGE